MSPVSLSMLMAGCSWDRKNVRMETPGALKGNMKGCKEKEGENYV